MPNIASVLKDEISRISRKEIRRETSSLKKSSTSYRSEIAALKRRVHNSSAAFAELAGPGRLPRPLQRTKTLSRLALALARGALPLSANASASQPPNAAFSSARRRSRSTTGRRARHARAHSTCRPSLRSGIWDADKRTRSSKPAKPPSDGRPASHRRRFAGQSCEIRSIEEGCDRRLGSALTATRPTPASVAAEGPASLTPTEGRCGR